MNYWNKLRSWLRGPNRPVRARRANRARLAIELLEDRVVPTTTTLTSGSLPAPPHGQSADFRAIIGLDGVQASYPAYTGAGYSVAVIDTGINYNDPNLGGGFGKRVIAGYNFVNNTSDPMDDNGHGTFVAGEIASSSTQFPGVAPAANLVAVKVLDKTNQGTWANIDAGLQWVVAHRVQYNIVAVNLSLGSGNYTSDPYNILETELANLKNAGVFISVASGNEYQPNGSAPGLAYPAVDPVVVSVGATWAGSYGAVTFFGATDNNTAAGQLADFTQRDSALSLLAPGAWITSEALSGGYTQFGGTSMAAAVVSGAAVVLHQALDALGQSANANEDFILHVMQTTGTPVTDNNTGTNVVPTGLTFRQLNLKAALDAIVPRPVTPPPSSALALAPITNLTIAPRGTATLPLATADTPGATVSLSAQIVDLGALAYQLSSQLGLSTTGSYHLNQSGLNEKWLIDANLRWYWLLPNGEFRRYAGSVAATLLPANLVATFDASYYADPRKLWYAPFQTFAPINLSINGSQLIIQSTSSAWTGPVVIAVTATDGTSTVRRTFTLNVAGTAVSTGVPVPPVLASLPNLTVSHSKRPLVVTLAATPGSGTTVTFTAQVVPSGGLTPPVTVVVKGNQLSLTPALAFVGTYRVTVTASNGSASATTTFSVTVTDAPPQLAAIAPQTMVAGQNRLTLPLSATDTDGDALTFSAAVLTPSATLYQLEQKLGLHQYNGSYFTNIQGANEKWLVDASLNWYALLPSGQLYRWVGFMAKTLQPANLVATLDPSVYLEPRLLWQAAPATTPAISATLQGNQLIVQRPAGLLGVYAIQVTVTDGAVSAQQTFLVTLN